MGMAGIPAPACRVQFGRRQWRQRWWGRRLLRGAFLGVLDSGGRTPRDVIRGMFQGLGPARCTRVQLRVSRRFNWCSPHQSVRRLIRSPLMASTNALGVPKHCPCHLATAIGGVPDQGAPGTSLLEPMSSRRSRTTCSDLPIATAFGFQPSRRCSRWCAADVPEVPRSPLCQGPD
jgi:hypothetical protein